ncbi:hypothetical protein JCM17844_19060 [Iodidimonas gelatinilytica]|uniref:Flagellar basal-body/hook protein C-terminal domain-containing protein n=1 Tax=Iodidimonas gelatinilytica TaxID=1236966 RepID=A0A5A7MTS3_9PROT|nr:flagellar basal body rod C-terminal domain-containing protein [Iodidimonas gelatinilytica]GEQ98269.1 hypothetical protein JCM17844_19060 [Iodidimonas gelatinilytica]
MKIVTTALSGLMANQQRLETSAQNIVNANSTGNRDTVFQPQRTVLSPAPNGSGVVALTSPVSPASFPAFQPDSPNADEAGLVETPNVSLIGEIVEMKSAEASYKASLRLLETAQDLSEQLLDTGDRDERG